LPLAKTPWCPQLRQCFIFRPMSSKMTFLQWNHYMILVSIAYLRFYGVSKKLLNNFTEIVNDLKVFLLKQNEDNQNKAVFQFIR
jgi:hypothetical protein